MKKYIQKYRENSYAPAVSLIIMIALTKLFFWVSRTEEVWPYLGLKESFHPTPMQNLIGLFFYYGEFVTIILAYALLAGLLYSAIYQIKLGQKKSGIINLILSMLFSIFLF